MSKFADVFSAVGLEQYAFTPSGALSLDQWPTLQTLINDGTRLVVWMGKFLGTHALHALGHSRPACLV